MDRTVLRGSAGDDARHRPGTARWRRRAGAALVALLATVATHATPALAHAGHEESDSSHELAALLLVLGGGLVLTALIFDRFGDLPRQYVQGLLVGGTSLVLVLAPLFWFL